MRKLVLALAVAFCSFQSWSQSDCGELLDHDQDGIIGVADLMNLLSLFGQPLEVTAGPCDNLESVTFDGYDYDLVEIGDQCWFAENLRTEYYANGDSIPANLTESEWVATTSGAVAVYGEDLYCENHSPDGDACDPVWSLNEYGRLYNWYAVDDDRGLCPMGWHVPSDWEWTVMTDILGGGLCGAGGTMKTTYGWNYDGNGTNSSGFSGLPGGYRNSPGGFYRAGIESYWWSSTATESYSEYRVMIFGSTSIHKFSGYRGNGYSVRCLKDSNP